MFLLKRHQCKSECPGDSLCCVLLLEALSGHKLQAFLDGRKPVLHQYIHHSQEALLLVLQEAGYFLSINPLRYLTLNLTRRANLHINVVIDCQQLDKITLEIS